MTIKRKDSPSPFSPPPDVGRGRLRGGGQQLIVILGPTASGKSSLAIKLAKKFKGEIISADSRQVYRGMDIGTGKVTKKEQKLVPHHLLDIVDPKKQYTASDFQTDAKNAIAEIASKGKTPFLVGGTAFYIYAVIDGLRIPEAKPNPKLRKALEKKPTKDLQEILKALDPRRYKTIDKNNRVRLIRAIEINVVTGKPVPALHLSPTFPPPPGGREGEVGGGGQALLIGIKKDLKKLDQLIDKRVDQRLKAGMVAETKKLLKSGVKHKRLQQFGLEYRFASDYLQDKLDYNDMAAELKIAIHQFARRQMTWFKRDKRIHWVSNQNQAERAIKKFLDGR